MKPMNENENRKELADEALDAVAGGSDRFAALLGGQACADCPRIDASVYMREVIYGGDSLSINLCPDCVAKRRQRGQVVR